jgi:16S rRNA (cytosine967-C5)-methyltransferase
MTKIPFRDHHLLQLLSDFDKQTLPIDVFMSIYFRERKALGSKDRAYISDLACDLIRWRGLLDACQPKPSSWIKRLSAYQNGVLKSDHSSFCDHVRCSFPKELFNLFKDAYGREQAIEIALASNERAPLTVRANALKITREDLIKKWEPHLPLNPCKHSPVGINVNTKTHLFSLDEFKEGFFEIQDESSQRAALMMDPRPGQNVLDYCAGSGGKTLAFANKLKGKGQIYLHDIRLSAFRQAKKRLKRAGIENAQYLLPEHPTLKKLNKRMDWVFVDAPCTGTGTLRRNPDMKWRFSSKGLQELVTKQRVIFEEAIQYLKPNGTIIFATCSLLPEENEEQIAYFMEKFSLVLAQPVLKTFPSKNEGDGFFAAALKRA